MLSEADWDDESMLMESLSGVSVARVAPNNVCLVPQQYETPLFPCGCIFKLCLLSTHGDGHYVGLSGAWSRVRQSRNRGGRVVESTSIAHRTPSWRVPLAHQRAIVERTSSPAVRHRRAERRPRARRRRGTRHCNRCRMRPCRTARFECAAGKRESQGRAHSGQVNRRQQPRFHALLARSIHGNERDIRVF